MWVWSCGKIKTKLCWSKDVEVDGEFEWFHFVFGWFLVVRGLCACFWQMKIKVC